jgi:hypothetical protein
MVDYHLIHLVFLISSLFHRFLNVKYDLSLPALVCLDMLEVVTAFTSARVQQEGINSVP